MAGFASAVPGWPCIADAGRRTADRHRGSAPGRSRRVAIRRREARPAGCEGREPDHHIGCPTMSVLPLVPTDEEASLRESVAGICSGFGPKYMRECNAEGRPPRDLWDALADKGYLGANLPEEYGGGGLGMTGLSAVGEEISAAGCSLLLIVVSPAICGSILVRHG